MYSPSLRSCAGDNIVCDESPRSGSFCAGESGTAVLPSEPYLPMSLQSGTGVAGTGGIDPYLRRSPGSVAVCAIAEVTSGGMGMGATAIATATTIAVDARAQWRGRASAHRPVEATSNGVTVELGGM